MSFGAACPILSPPVWTSANRRHRASGAATWKIWSKAWRRSAQSPHGGSGYRDPLIEIFDWLEARVAAVVADGVQRSNILVDPGIGFGKSLADNLALMNGLTLFHGLGLPLMLGASRKRIIGALDHEAPVEHRLGGSLALALKGAEAGCQLLRVHDVADTVQAVRVWRGMRDAALTAR